MIYRKIVQECRVSLVAIAIYYRITHISVSENGLIEGNDKADVLAKAGTKENLNEIGIPLQKSKEMAS